MTICSQTRSAAKLALMDLPGLAALPCAYVAFAASYAWFARRSRAQPAIVHGNAWLREDFWTV